MTCHNQQQSLILKMTPTQVVETSVTINNSHWLWRWLPHRLSKLQSQLTTVIDSEDDFHTGCRNVSHDYSNSRSLRTTQTRTINCIQLQNIDSPGIRYFTVFKNKTLLWHVSDCSSQALGLVSRRIKDHQITASSYSSDWTRPSAGRLLNKGYAPWSPAFFFNKNLLERTLRLRNGLLVWLSV